MNINITKQEKIPLLSRVELEGDISFTGATPDRRSVKNELAKKLGVKPGLLIIVNIDGSFGVGQSKLKAFQYFSEDDMKNSGYDHLKKRGPKGKEEEAPAAQAPKVEEKKEEVAETEPADEKVESPKEESKEAK